MQKSLTVAVSMILTGFTTQAQAISLYDYQEANSSYEDLYFTGSFNFHDGYVDREVKDASGAVVKNADGSVKKERGRQDQSSYNLNTNLNYDRSIGSANRDIKLNANLAGALSRGTNDGDKSESTYQGTASADINNYFRPNSKGAFWYGSADLGAKKDADKVFSKVGAGIGYGRVVNVTPMARAIRIVEALNERGVARVAPSRAAYQQMASIIAREAEFRSRYGARDYHRYMIENIEQVLRSSGATNGLGAAGTVVLYDVLVDEATATRKLGWLVKGGVAQVIQDYDGTKSKPGLSIGAEYHRPLNNQTQFSNTAELTATLKDDNEGYNVQNIMTLSREISDRVDWNNSWQFNYNKSDKDGVTSDSTSNALRSTFSYSLNNKMSFDTTAGLSKTGDEDVDKTLNMGITYRLK